ncbi:unnamed protein product [Acanthoscelides obtectus]|uniref:PDZ domain-containing protein n=1 Tax=Acanthoscelides obtectus TaxID=200917 RepID=A0A9P0KK25_ACAOB|nr:unnamed protein product [Acanthoscelides obtectus]CAK1645777.1 SH3 and multiple ankyrin repeat domains protein 2 [Acanthoscelides obtectus]
MVYKKKKCLLFRKLLVLFTGATDDGYLEGTLRGSAGSRTTSGLFPAGAVQEVRMRHTPHVQAAVARGQVAPQGAQPTTRVAGRRESASGVGQVGKQFATAPRTAKGKSHWNVPAEPRTVVLHKGKKGFGFILRGAKATSPLLDLTPSEKCPALQYLDDVDPGGVADMAGLKKGDFLLEINNEDVSTSSHERVVELIRSSGDLVQMTVVTCVPCLPTSRSALPINPMAAQPANGGRQYAATLPRKAMGGTGSAGGTPRAQHAPLPPRRDPKTTLSVGRARAKSMVAGLGTEADQEDPKNSSAESVQQLNSTHSTPVPPRTASIRQRPASARIASAALEELFRDKEAEERLTSARFQQREGELMSSRFQGTHTLGSPVKNKVYASVAEMKRSKKQSSKVRFTDLFFPHKGGLKRTFHSTPDLAQECAAATASSTPNGGGAYRQSAYSTGVGTTYAFHRSQEDVSGGVGGARGLLPPPTHPPPPVPVGQVVKVEVGGGRASSGKGEYDRVVAQPQDRTQEQGEEGIVSSFKPTANAKLYASPDDGKNVIYRSKAAQLSAHHQSRSQLRKSQSMRSGSSFKPGPATPTTPTQPQPPQQTNPYAQPIRASRSNSTGSRERRKKIVQSKSANSMVKLAQGVTPSIPEPDYSCTDSEVESDEERKEPESLAARISSVHLQPVENSGNSNTSGSSSGSTSLPHSFSVEEIQRGRLLLKSSKSYPDELLKKQKEPDGKDGHLEDGDNSSSGVSSDQETAAGGGGEYAEGGVSVAVKGQRAQIGMLKRHAVSLAQLPPPIENENDEKEELCSLPPPPEYISTENATSFGEEIVVAPPPQFSDNRQVTRVRIVGAVPKSPPNGPATNVKQGRLHSQ